MRGFGRSSAGFGRCGKGAGSRIRTLRWKEAPVSVSFKTLSDRAEAHEEAMSRRLDDVVVKSVLYQSGDRKSVV